AEPVAGRHLQALERAGLHRCRAVHAGGAVAELTERVRSPAPDLVGGVDRAAVVVSAGHGDGRGQARHRYRDGRVGDGAVTELARGVLSPAPDRLVRHDGARMATTPGDDGQRYGHG